MRINTFVLHKETEKCVEVVYIPHHYPQPTDWQLALLLANNIYEVVTVHRKGKDLAILHVCDD